MERRRQLFDTNKHFRGITNVNSLNFKFNNTSYSVEANENGEFDFTYDFELTDLFSAFSGSSATTFEITELDTSNVTSMTLTFYDCKGLTFLDLSHFNTTKVTNMNRMFLYSSNLTSLDLSKWDTSNVTNMSEMFDGCTRLASLDLSNFDASNVTEMDLMFYGCPNLSFIQTNSKFRDWCIENASKINLPYAFRNINYEGWEIID